eukprot:UN20991
MVYPLNVLLLYFLSTLLFFHLWRCQKMFLCIVLPI